MTSPGEQVQEAIDRKWREDAEFYARPLDGMHIVRVLQALETPATFRVVVERSGLTRREARRALHSARSRGLVRSWSQERKRSRADRFSRRPMRMYERR